MKPTAKTAMYNFFIESCVWQNMESTLIVRFPSWSYKMNHIICFVFNIIQTLLTIFLNYLAVHALCKSPQLRRKTSLFLVMLLSVSDLVLGVTVAPTFLFHLAKEIYGTDDCFASIAKKILFDTLAAISFTIFFILNVEIYLSIIYPIFHKTKITNRRTFKVLCICVIVSIVRSYLFVFHVSKQGQKLFFSAFILLTLVALAFIHIKISVVAYKRRRVGFVGRDDSSNLQKSKTGFLRCVREAKSCLLVLFCTLLCYLPSVIEDRTKQTIVTVILLNPWRNTATIAASNLNSIIFFWRNGILRKEVKNIMKSISACLTQH